jgi:hypothetical protein
MQRKILSIAIIIFVVLWCSNLFATQYFPGALDMPADYKEVFLPHWSEGLKIMKEPPLWPKGKDHEAISYRFMYHHPFADAPVIFRLDKVTDKKWILTVKSKQPFRTHRERKLTQGEVDQFQRNFAQLQFWNAPTVGAVEAEMVKDGTTWQLEAVKDGIYHMVVRRVPKSNHWHSDPLFQKMKEKNGYPNIDQTTSAEFNNRFVVVCEFLVKLSGLKLELH